MPDHRPNEVPNQASNTPDLDRLREKRERLETRHAQGLTRLMGTRSDLRGVHALADLVDDAVRWSA
jgi:hypothetical protein